MPCLDNCDDGNDWDANIAYSHLRVGVDKAPRLSIRIVIWILPSDTVFVNSIKISANNETAMLSNDEWKSMRGGKVGD